MSDLKVNLPKTQLSMKANLPSKEPEILNLWETMNLYELQRSSSSKKEKFQVTTFRSISQDDLNRFKLSNYVNNNIDWGLMPGPPPTDCCIM